MKVRCNNLCMGFQDGSRRIEALKELTFECADGEFLSILGPSGCGKTTLLRLLAGLMKPNRGTIEPVASQTNANSRILLVFQEDSLFPWMTVMQNATFGLEMQGVSKTIREERARSLLDRMGISGREHSFPHQLSMGMKQRVAVIRCFLSEPGLMLMDEPFGALDSQTRSTLQQELLSLWDQKRNSVIFVTHDVEEALVLSDRILVLSSQPGSVVGEIHVPLPRPRTGETTLTNDFLSLKKDMYRLLKIRKPESNHVA